MDDKRPLWLICNAKSGSNDDTAIEAIGECCARGGLRVAYRTTFPDEDLPTPAMLDAAKVDLVAIFTGDGTLNAALTALSGWRGAVLVLPGGTMNLLYHRLFGEAEMEEVIADVAAGRTQRRRPAIIESDVGSAYAGLLAGPGTSWNRVREAMREFDVIEMAGSTIEAIERTLGAPGVACVEPRLGRPEGYPLVLLNPLDSGIEALAFHSENTGEYLEQAWALMRRDFRQGPHDRLGEARRMVLASSDGKPFGLLLDGEPVEAGPRTEFVLTACAVDLLASTA